MLDSDVGNVAYLLQLLLSGLSTGALYALFAVSFVVVWKASSHLNLAAGELGSLAVFAMASLTTSLGFGVWAALAVVLVASLGGGALLQHTLIRPADRRGVFAVVLTTLAVYLVVNAAVGLLWGTQARQAPSPFAGGSGGQLVLLDGPPRAYLTYGDLLALGTLAVVVGAITIGLHRTKLGLAYRAVASNRLSASLSGIPLSRMYMAGWAVSTAIAAMTAFLVGVRNGSIDFQMMTPMLAFGLTAATVGGLDSIRGAVIAGLALGIVVELVPGVLTAVSGDLGLIIALVLVLLTLLVRPQGLYGTKRLERV